MHVVCVLKGDQDNITVGGTKFYIKKNSRKWVYSAHGDKLGAHSCSSQCQTIPAAIAIAATPAQFMNFSAGCVTLSAMFINLYAWQHM
jgi:hypothetical protein